jgi:UDP-2,3-diacylglucosamine pyrophosphatase LpxH
MRFIKRKSPDKTIICISDLHLGAGVFFNGKKNNLEDFFYDKELVDFLEFYSSDKYMKRDVELIINGDFLDFLSVPYVNYFDDEFWSEDSSLEKLKIIMSGHKEVFEALKKFSSLRDKKITYIIGNHDAELDLTKVKKYFMDYFNQRINLISLTKEGFKPIKSVLIHHGHQSERANSFDENSIQKDEQGREFLIPPWGSYFVAKVINRFKSESPHVNSVRPIKKFIIDGLIYDSMTTLRFLLATVYYYIMVRFIYIFKQGKFKEGVVKLIEEEFDVFNAPEDLKYQNLTEDDGLKILLQGHTHKPEISYLRKGKVFINTGTWTNMYQLDFGKSREEEMLTFAKLDVFKLDEKEEKIDSNLLVWKGRNQNPFIDF